MYCWTKSEWADYAAVQAECGNLTGNELTRSLSGNTRSQSSQLDEPLWTDLGLKSEISVRELISTKKQNKTKQKAKAENEWSPKILASEKKATTTILLKTGFLTTALETCILNDKLALCCVKLTIHNQSQSYDSGTKHTVAMGAGRKKPPLSVLQRMWLFGLFLAFNTNSTSC